ncbi:MAG: hypothetical protein RBS80_23710 [Thermoguttaceae bacterium]|jgi:hypothetical protein|nr:hypothetical protein [Thermoguttaceae bacterium]
MPEKSIRFGVRDTRGRRAATWKIWTRTGSGKSDVYLACRSLGGTLKASMHDSGSWHIGFLRAFVEMELPEEDPKRENPYIERWPRPGELAPGLTLAYRIVVPTVAVNIPISDPLPASIKSIPAAAKGKAVEIDVVFTAPGTKVSNWPGRNAMKTELVGQFVLENGETVWIVHHVIDVPPLPTATGNLRHFKSGENIELAGPNVRGIVFGSSDDGSRFMIECLIQRNREAS